MRWWHPLGRWTWPTALAGALLWQRAAGEVPWATVDGWVVVWLVMLTITVHDSASPRTPEGQLPSLGAFGAEIVKLLGMVAVGVWLVVTLVQEYWPR